jgi:glycosyltransferase involved in cell wall biosynthesis
LKSVITVNDSIAQLYHEKYGKEVTVIRNVPETLPPVEAMKPADIGIPEGNAIVIFQGSGINIQRGAEEAIDAMKYLEGVTLLFVGGGDVIGQLKERARNGLQEKVLFIPRQAPNDLRRYTAMAHVGLSLDKDSNINYRFSLPNKLFDYIHAGVPVLVSDLVEVKKITEQYQIGLVAASHDPQHLATCIRRMLDNKQDLFKWKENLKIAARELCWENEKRKMIELIHAI